MLAEHIGVDIVDVHLAGGAEQMAKTSTVQHRARSKHPSSRPARSLKGHAGQDIHGVADDEDYARGIVLDDVGDDVADDGGVFLEKLQPRLAGPLGRPRRDNDQLRVGVVAGAADANGDGREEGLPVHRSRTCPWANGSFLSTSAISSAKPLWARA